MAVIRDAQTDDNTINYISTLAFFCCVSCIIGMLKFGKFKTSFNVYSEKKRKSVKGQDVIGSVMSINGAYRTNRDEFFIYNNLEPQRKLTPSVSVPPPILPEAKSDSTRQTKSASDLIKNKNLPQSLREAQSEVSPDPRGADNENRNARNKIIDSKNNKQLDAEKRVEKQRNEEQKKLEKQRLEEKKKLEKQRQEEEKKRERLALQERAKQDKLKKEREKRETQQLKKGKKNKTMAPQRPLANPLAQSSNKTMKNTTEPSRGPNYSTNTLESSISKTSGPPPYSEDLEKNENENNSNVTFGKPVDTGSWDMISQHRHNVCVKKPLKTDPPQRGKVTTLDLNFSLGEQTNRDNSEV